MGLQCVSEKRRWVLKVQWGRGSRRRRGDAHYLRERLEQEDGRTLYDVSAPDVRRIIGLLGIR